MHVTGYLHGGVKRKKAKERKAYKYMYAYDRINGIEMVENGDKFQCLALPCSFLFALHLVIFPFFSKKSLASLIFVAK